MTLSLAVLIGLASVIVTVIIAAVKGIITFGGTSELTQTNKEDIESIRDDIDSIRDDLDKKLDEEGLEELRGRVGDLEAKVHSIREDISYLEGAIGKEDEKSIKK